MWAIISFATTNENVETMAEEPTNTDHLSLHDGSPCLMWVALVPVKLIFKNSLLHTDTGDAIPLIHLNGLWSQRGRMQQCALTWHFGWYWQFQGNNLPRNSSHPLGVLWETLLSRYFFYTVHSYSVIVSSFSFTLWPGEQAISKPRPSLPLENERRMKARCHFYLL